jgi:hypothetical protein
MQDMWRGSKGHNPRSHTKTYTDLSLLERDGVHPKKILAKLWLRRIATVYGVGFTLFLVENLTALSIVVG